LGESAGFYLEISRLQQRMSSIDDSVWSLSAPISHIDSPSVQSRTLPAGTPDLENPTPQVFVAQRHFSPDSSPPVAHNINKYKSNERGASLTRFNNQNSILMCSATNSPQKAKPQHDFVMLMHETRIFYFRLTKEEWDNLDESMGELTNLFLILLTTQKYRVLSAFYLIFRLADNTMLLALVIAMFLDMPTDNFVDILKENYIIFSVLAVESFYNVMQFTVRIWILNRISIYIGLLLFGLYAAAFTYLGSWNHLITILFILRFMFFFLEEVVDYCIDREIEYDLDAKRICPMPWQACVRKLVKLTFDKTVLNASVMPQSNYNLEGSLCAWNFSNAFRITPEVSGTCCWIYPHRGFLTMMFLIAMCLFGPLLAIMIILVSIFSLIKLIYRCTCKRKKNPEKKYYDGVWYKTILGEMIYEHSF